MFALIFFCGGWDNVCWFLAVVVIRSNKKRRGNNWGLACCLPFYSCIPCQSAGSFYHNAPELMTLHLQYGMPFEPVLQLRWCLLWRFSPLLHMKMDYWNEIVS